MGMARLRSAKSFSLAQAELLLSSPRRSAAHIFECRALTSATPLPLKRCCNCFLPNSCGEKPCTPHAGTPHTTKKAFWALSPHLPLQTPPVRLFPIAPPGTQTSSVLPSDRNCLLPVLLRDSRTGPAPVVTTVHSHKGQQAPQHRRGQEQFFSTGLLYVESGGAGMNQRKPGSLGDECFFEPYWLEKVFFFLEPCRSANRDTSFPSQLGKHFLENIPFVLQSPPLPSLFWKRSTCSGNKPKDGSNAGRYGQACRLSL